MNQASKKKKSEGRSFAVVKRTLLCHGNEKRGAFSQEQIDSCGMMENSGIVNIS